MSYKNLFYRNYATSHTSLIYGEPTQEQLRDKWPLWLHYYKFFFPHNKNSRILDLGCGAGEFVAFLHAHGFSNTVGIDMSQEQVALAKKLQIQNIVEGDANTYLAEHPNTFDVIVARDLLEHFAEEEVVTLVQKLAEALTPQGYVLLQTANAANPLWGRVRYGDLTHSMAFTTQSMTQLLGVCGFKTISHRSLGVYVHGIKSLCRYLCLSGMIFFWRLYLLAETGSATEILTPTFLTIARR